MHLKSTTYKSWNMELIQLTAQDSTINACHEFELKTSTMQQNQHLDSAYNLTEKIRVFPHNKKVQSGFKMTPQKQCNKTKSKFTNPNHKTQEREMQEVKLERKKVTRALISLPFLPRSLVTITLGLAAGIEKEEDEDEASAAEMDNGEIRR